MKESNNETQITSVHLEEQKGQARRWHQGVSGFVQPLAQLLTARDHSDIQIEYQDSRRRYRIQSRIRGSTRLSAFVRLGAVLVLGILGTIALIKGVAMESVIKAVKEIFSSIMP